MRVKNRVNVVYFRTKHVIIIVKDVDQIMKKQLKHRLHFENVFDYVKLLEASIIIIETKRNLCLLFSLSRANVVD
jgi:Trk K+ transport system NAD-binding subunit